MLGLAEEGVPVIQARIAERLGRSAPSVSEMLDRLIEDGYVTREGRRLVADRERPGAGREGGAQAPVGRAPAGRRHRARMAQGAPRGRAVGARDLRRRRGAAGRAAGRPGHLPAREPHPGVALGRARRPRPARWPRCGEGERVRLFRISEEVELNLGSLTLLDEGGFIPGVVARVGGRDGDGNVEVTVEGGERPISVSPALSDRLFVGVAVTLRLVADAVFTVDADDTVLAPGAVEIDDGLISWVGDPWQVPPAHRHRGAPSSAACSCPAWSTATATRP